MASIASHTIYSKTAKGLAEVRNKTGNLSREFTAILESVDGKARFSQLQAECGMSRPEMQRALEALALQGLIQEVATGIHQGAGANTAEDDTADLDFSSPDAIAKFNKQAERELRMQAEKRTGTGAKTRPETDPRKRAEAEVARARAQAEVKKRMEAEAKKRAQAEAERRAQADAKKLAEIEAKALAEAEKHASVEEVRPAEDEFQRRAREEAELRERDEARASRRSAEEIQALEGEKRRAREEAAAKARAEAEAKARIEAEAKARVDAEAKARADAEAKTRAEAEAKVRAEAEAKARVEAEAKARADAEAKARAEAELKARVEAEVKARVEAKAKALAEAEAKRAETEAKARADAERRSREDSERRARDESERRAREDAERRAREEAERRAREEAEAKARAQEELRAHEEAVANARAEEDGRAREEADAKARQEAARRALEEAAAARAAEVPSTRDIAELRKLEDQDRQAAAGAHAWREADSWGHRAAASAGAGDADKARTDATAGGEAAESGQPLVAPSATDLVRKLKAKVQAEWRARGESTGSTLASPADSELSSAFPTATGSVPSETDAPDISAALRELSEDPDSRAERPVTEHVPSALESAMLQASGRNESSTESQQRRDSGRARADELGEPTPRDFRAMDNAAIPLSAEGKPLHQRVNADRAAYDVLAHAATERHQVDAALGHTVVDEDARRSARALRRQRQTRVVAALGILLIAAPVLATAWLQFVPLDSYIPEAQQALSEQLNQPATISTLRYVLLPTPRVVLEGVKVGKGIHINRVEAPSLPQALSSVPRVFDTVSAHGLTIQAETLGTIPDWKSATTSRGVRVKRLVLEGVKIEGADSGLPTLNGEITFTADGTPRQAAFTSEKLKLDVGPEPNGLRIVLTAQDSRIPFGPQVKFSHLTIAGVAARNRFTSTEMSAGVGGGVLNGTLQASWEGQITVAGDFKVQRVRLQEFVPLVAADFAGSGLLTASGRYTFQSQTADTLMARPVVEATFSLARGELTNIDLLRATQSSGSNAFSGGRTMFEEVKGSLQIAGGQYSYRLQLTSGPLNASGNLAVAASGQLSGRVTSVLTAHGAEVARTALNVGGTVKEPQLAQ